MEIQHTMTTASKARKGKAQPTLPGMAELLDTLANGDWTGFRAGLEALYAATGRQTITINIQIEA
jgi:hypothetical protein